MDVINYYYFLNELALCNLLMALKIHELLKIVLYKMGEPFYIYLLLLYLFSITDIYLFCFFF
jgi:hypothetical protein